jgi:uncharacterized spore protein YtfJ
MEMQFEKLLEHVTSFIQTEARSETVVGEPFTLGEFSCIPVIRVGMGFGTGGGEGDAPKAGHGEGGGAGAGLGIEPIGFLVSRGPDISFLSTKTNRGLAAAFEKVPDLLEKYLDSQAKEEKVAV